MDGLGVFLGDGVKCVFKIIVNETKHLVNLPDDAERLRREIRRVRGIVDDINSRLSRQGRQPLTVVRSWLSAKEEIITSSEEVLRQYEKSKDCCWYCCCLPCFIAQRSSHKIRYSLAEIDRLLKMKESDFEKNGELGEPPDVLIFPRMENGLVGKDAQEKLSEMETWLLEDHSVRIVGVYGMPGVGKTSLLKQINNNEKVVDFFNLVIWVTVSRDSDISAIQKSIFDKIELPWRSNLSTDEAAGMLHMIFKERRLLLILDDVWRTIDVSYLGISLSENKSKVVVTSRDKGVCKGMGAEKVIGMNRLSEEEGWELFCRGAFVGGDVQLLDREILPFAREIAKECKGHPLAVKTLARAMPQLQSSTASQWEYILRQLKTIDPVFYRIHEEIMTELFKPLKRSYDALETDELRYCFLYMAAYREGEEMDADELVQLWMAEGLVKSRDEGRYSFLKRLEDRCLVEIEVKEENGLDISRVKIHDVLRDMAVRVAEVEQNTLSFAGQSLNEISENVSPSSVRISLMHNYIRFLPDSFDYEKLLSLLLSWNIFEVVPEGFLEKLNMLKVLDLSNTLIQFLPVSINQLKHLIYLQLSNTQIRVIPDQTFELIKLQFLDLSFSNLKGIPSMIKQLKRLQILKVAYCYDLEFISCDISELTRLEEFDIWMSTMSAISWEVREGEEVKEASLQDICKLHRLKRLRLTLKSPVEERTLGTLVELEELWLLWMPEVRQTHLPTDMRRLQKLERLHLYDCDIEAIPDLFSQLQRLRYLKLFSSQLLLTLSGLGLGGLSDLKEMEIEECHHLKELGEEFGRAGCFPNLRKLKLRMLSSLENLCTSVEEGALPMLQTMTVFRCMNFKLLPWGLHNLNSLKQISGDKEWWDEISWQDEEMKRHLHSKYVEIVEIHEINHV